MSSETTTYVGAETRYTPANTLSATWLIAKRQALEAIMTRTTLIMMVFWLAFLTVMVVFVLGGGVDNHSTQGQATTATEIAFLLALMGLMFSQTSIGIAAGVFAGDKERGCLLPLLATPASNLALFAGKVLGAVLPALSYAAIGIIVYYSEIGFFFGMETLRLTPIGLSLLILVLIVAGAFLGAGLASVISSRVSTYQSAQTYSSLITTILSVGVSILIFFVPIWGIWVFALVLAGICVLDVLLIAWAAATWQREEVMARQ